MKQRPKIVTLENKKLVGCSIKMSLVNNKTFELFSGFMPNIKLIEEKVSTDIFEVLIYDSNYLKNFNPENTFTKWAAVEVEKDTPIPENMESLTIENGLYAVFTYKGLAKNFGNFMQYIYTDYLPKSKYKIDNLPHFNLLNENYKRNHPDSQEDVWIPIQLK